MTPCPAAFAAPCTRLLGASFWRPEGSAVEALLALRAELLRRFEESGVRTAFLYTGGWLVEWHEGPAAAVDAAWSRVLADPACGFERLLHRSEGPATLVEPVALATLHAGEKAGDVARRIQQLPDAAAGEPAELWQVLSAPGRCAVTEAPAAAPHDVVAVTSEDNESVELLRGLARDSGVPVAYQRFAGADVRRGDVGAAYADLPTGFSAITRVQALSRRALAHGLARLGLRRLERLIVLLGDPGSRTSALLVDVADLLATFRVPPTVVVVSASGESRAAGVAALRRVPGVHVEGVEAGAAGRPVQAEVARVLRVDPTRGGDALNHPLWNLLAAEPVCGDCNAP